MSRQTASGAFLTGAKEVTGITLQVAQRRDGGRRARWLPGDAEPPVVPRFAVAPRRWVVEIAGPGVPLAIAVVVTLLVYWAAEGYAELLGEQIHAGRLPTREQVRAALAGLWPMVTASYVPLLALGWRRCGATGGWTGAASGWRPRRCWDAGVRAAARAADRGGAVAGWFIGAASRIRLAVLGRLPGNRRSVDLADHPDATTTPGLLLVRPDGPVVFANATHSG